MLQHILGAHPRVATLPEPWFMLPLVCSARPGACNAEYNSEYARMAFEGFLDYLPSGRNTHLLAMREFALRLYAEAVRTKPGADCFLDKTPRYYFIIDELIELFPDAGFVLLVRNPLAVFSSTLSYHLNDDLPAMIRRVDHRHDLLTAPKLITKAFRQHGSKLIKVKYEELVYNPEPEVQRICKGLGLEFDPGMLEYGARVGFKSPAFGDTKSIYKHKNAVTSYVDSWLDSMLTGKSVQLALAYLDCLDDEVLSCFGEDRTCLHKRVLESGEGLLGFTRSRLKSTFKKALLEGYGALTRAQKLQVDWRGILLRRVGRLNPLKVLRRVMPKR